MALGNLYISLVQDVDIRKRIELIQDFDMPALSDRIRVSKDGQYVLATGKHTG
jgi:ribosome biogenesis protein ENP2